MISYRPVPDLAPGRRGVRAAVAAMALAAVLGTAAFAPAGAGSAAVGGTRMAVVVGTAGGLPAEQTTLRRQDTGGSLEQGAAAGPLTA